MKRAVEKTQVNHTVTITFGELKELLTAKPVKPRSGQPLLKVEVCSQQGMTQTAATMIEGNVLKFFWTEDG